MLFLEKIICRIFVFGNVLFADVRERDGNWFYRMYFSTFSGKIAPFGFHLEILPHLEACRVETDDGMKALRALTCPAIITGLICGKAFRREIKGVLSAFFPILRFGIPSLDDPFHEHEFPYAFSPFRRYAIRQDPERIMLRRSRLSPVSPLLAILLSRIFYGVFRERYALRDNLLAVFQQLLLISFKAQKNQNHLHSRTTSPTICRT
jgi:hypothetical protein